MKNEYEKLDDDGRDIFYKATSGHIKDYLFTDPTNEVDMYITGNTDTKAVVEIKYRPKCTSRYIENIGGQMFEIKKYNALMGQKKIGYKPLYAVIFNDRIVIWNVSYLTNDDFVYEKDKYPKSTVEGKEEKEPKWVAYLKLSDACTIMRYKYEKDNRKDSN